MGHIERVLCLQGLILMKQQLVAWTYCVFHIFIYLIQTFVEWHTLDISHHSQLISYVFYQERVCKSVVLGKGLPLNHLTMLCCHVAYLGEKKVFFVDRSGVVKLVFNLLL